MSESAASSTSTVPGPRPSPRPQGSSAAGPRPAAEITTSAAPQASTTVFGRRGNDVDVVINSNLPDFGSDRDGKMSNFAANKFLTNLLRAVEDDDSVKISDLDELERAAFTASVYAHLALNTGSVNADDGSLPSTYVNYLSFGDRRVPAVDMRALYGDDAYRFMRARADSIAATLLLQIERSKDPDPTKWVLAKEYVRDLRVVAARKGMTEFPHLCFVGAEYVANLSHRARTLIFESSANVLSSRVNTRDDSRLRSMAAVAKTGGLGM